MLFIRLADALHPPPPDHQSKRISVSKPYVSVQQSNDHPAQQRAFRAASSFRNRERGNIPIRQWRGEEWSGGRGETT